MSWLIEASSVSASRAACAFLCRRRELARHDRHGDKHAQHDPVLWIGDEERPDRLDEEEVEGQHRHDRRQHRHAQPGKRGRGQHNQQEHQRHRGGVDVRDPLEQIDGEPTPASPPSRMTASRREAAGTRALL
jgi:hypothetical protein